MSTNHRKQLGYFVTLGCVAVAAFLILSTWSGGAVEAMAGSHSAPNAIQSVVPNGSGGETSVPAASSVFFPPSYSPEEHVQAF